MSNEDDDQMNGDNSYLQFDGIDDYIEIPSSSDFSVATGGALTVSLWIRPAVLIFPSTEGGDEKYVHFAGKGERGQQEWVFRIYSQDNGVGRANRISFYVFNLKGGEGVGSHFQDPGNPVQAGVWLHVVGAADNEKTYIFINGTLIDSDVYVEQIIPQNGNAPLRIGTRDFSSYFQGQIRELRIWNRLLSESEVNELYNTGLASPDGLVAEYLLGQDIAVDTAGTHNGTIDGPIWVPRDG
jgi:hypothetical protein